ncbi:SGNH/GDSL hydrolase family protein [Novosphingobium terrae]|uniref:SGNH/GDSL hydrolase family protein n=1 Tax=Novosphingobium terrae TaxID=2726189 RepID=UPI00197CD588
MSVKMPRRLSALLAVTAAFLCPAVALAQNPSWVGTWMASPQPVWNANFAFPTKIPASVKDKTFRQIVRIGLGGSQVRLVFSNTYGDAPFRIGAASVALTGSGSASVEGVLHAVTFGGQTAAVIAPGTQLISDPIAMPVADQARLAVSAWLPDETPLRTFHWDGRQSAWFADGDLTQSSTFPTNERTDARILLSEVLVDAANTGAVVVIGDSITDGNGATVDADTRWPDFLSRRIAPHHVAILNAGISGARLLEDKMGVNALARLDRDVFAQPDVKAIILLIGINDIAWPGTAFARKQDRPTADAMIAGYRQIIEQAHTRHIRVIGSTLTPFAGALSGTPLGDYFSPEKDLLRQEINRWIRTSGAFDAVVDFDKLLRDPAHPERIAPAFDSGDHLHPGDKGNAAMADAIDPRTLLGR